MKFLTSVGLMAFLILSGGVSQGAPITIRLSGIIDGASNYYGDQLKSGDLYTATFLFESSTPDLLPNDPQTGSYRSLASTIVAGQMTFTGSPDGGILTIVNGTDMDSLRLTARNAGYPIGDATFTDSTAGVFSNDALLLPATAPPLGAFQDIAFEGGDGYVKFNGSITSLAITPEPGTLCLLVLGMALIRRRA